MLIIVCDNRIQCEASTYEYLMVLCEYIWKCFHPFKSRKDTESNDRFNKLTNMFASNLDDSFLFFSFFFALFFGWFGVLRCLCCCFRLHPTGTIQFALSSVWFFLWLKFVWSWRKWEEFEFEKWIVYENYKTPGRDTHKLIHSWERLPYVKMRFDRP